VRVKCVLVVPYVHLDVAWFVDIGRLQVMPAELGVAHLRSRSGPLGVSTTVQGRKARTCVMMLSRRSLYGNEGETPALRDKWRILWASWKGEVGVRSGLAKHSMRSLWA
jgi:hypothetical protein